MLSGTYKNKQGQRGATLIGMLIIVAIVGAGLYAAIRLTPLYLEYFAVVRAMEQVAKSNDASSTSPAEIRRGLQNRWDVEDIKTVDVKDIQVVKAANGGYDITAEYRAEAPFVANVSLVVDFNKTVELR